MTTPGTLIFWWFAGAWMSHVPVLGTLLFGAAEPLPYIDTSPAYLR